MVLADPDDRVVFEIEGDWAVALIAHADGREIRGERMPFQLSLDRGRRAAASGR